MSDTAIAPAAAPAAPAANETPINPNPVSSPNPVGSQAPDKPVGPDFKGSEHRPPSRRETIAKAFEKARAEIKPADAKMGHNNPPEETKREASKAAPTVERKPKDERPGPIDLKKRPVDQEQPRREPQPRVEHGHFGARAAEAGEQQRTQAAPGVQRQHDQPLQRMTDAAKKDWAKTPESVRADVHRMHTEFGRAYQQYRGDHETMNTIRPFAQMAQQHGTTLARALENYTGMEKYLRSDVVGGLDTIVNNLNLTTGDGRRISLLDVAWHIVNQTPEQRQLLQSKNSMMAQSHQLAAANQRIAALEQNAKQEQYRARFVQQRGVVDEYAKTHPRLDEIGDLVEQEIKLGFDLDTAYKRAELLRPATAAQTRNGQAAHTRSTSAQTRTEDRSISGAPGGPSNGRAGPHRDKPVGRREAIANAIRRANGSL